MYHNRDISWLGFNHRVLQEAADLNVPLLERIKFLSIFSNNMDEFFRVRYPVIAFYATLKNKMLSKMIPPYDKKLAERVQEIIGDQLDEFGNIINSRILPALEEKNIFLYYNKPLPGHFRSQVRELFFSTILAYIQPIFLEDKSRQAFFPENNQLYFFVLLKKEGRDDMAHAVVNIPAGRLPRFYKFTQENGDQHIVFIDDIIRDNLNCIFPGFTIHGCFSFKVNRNSELFLDEESLQEDLLHELEKKLAKRDMGNPTRFLYETGMPMNILQFLAGSFGVKQEELYEGGRYHNLKDLATLPISCRELEYPAMPQIKPPGLEYCGDLFRLIETRDLLLHFPYESYSPVLAFFNQAAIDPDVKFIAVTLYRVASESNIVNALISAAKNKKQVQVFVELKARFDEANNIRWSREMEKAGVRIIYSIPGIKVHSKIALVIKRIGGKETGYGYVGTGNFNETTARFYCDHALFTGRKEVLSDLRHLFSMLEKRKRPEKDAVHEFNYLLVSQYNMMDQFSQEIRNQVKRKKKGKNALIRIKLNNLENPEIINQLYKAGQAGVEIRLLVRGICCLAPGKPGLSENITVKRIVDRYLEHSRFFIFGEDDDCRVYLGSADWMTRNLFQRIEVCTPVEDRWLQDELISYFEIQWSDEAKSVWLDAELEQHRSADPGKSNGMGPQARLYEYLKNRP